MRLWSFNPRAHVGRDKPRQQRPRITAKSFNPRAHVGRDAWPHGHAHLPIEFQSTRPRGARRSSLFAFLRLFLVSIHAPTWGATFNTYTLLYTRKVSIHAPTWGATSAIGETTQEHMFQSTRPRGARRRDGRDKNKGFREFQSTRPRGARLQVPRVRVTVLGGFNPRAHVGRDPVLHVTFPPLACFNPRAHVGRDRDIIHDFNDITVSIHAPTWGATAGSANPYSPGRFQSTRPRGARL